MGYAVDPHEILLDHDKSARNLEEYPYRTLTVSGTTHRNISIAKFDKI